MAGGALGDPSRLEKPWGGGAPSLRLGEGERNSEAREGAAPRLRPSWGGRGSWGGASLAGGLLAELRPEREGFAWDLPDVRWGFPHLVPSLLTELLLLPQIHLRHLSQSLRYDVPYLSRLLSLTILPSSKSLLNWCLASV